MTKQVYLAARYSRREELCKYREQLHSLGGYLVESQWLNGKHQIDNLGFPIGDQGEKLVGDSILAHNLRSVFAEEDYQDVSNADIVISFTEAPRSHASRGGRHVEFGVALATPARVIVIGHRENIFHYLHFVEFYPTWEECLDKLAKEVA